MLSGNETPEADVFVHYSGVHRNRLRRAAHHQYWSGLSAILIFLFGWFLALRGLVLLAAPHVIASGVAVAMNMMPFVRIGFGLLVLAGL